MNGSGLCRTHHPSPNYDYRAPGFAPTILILHYTGMATSAEALHRLCDPFAKVSAHYLVDEEGGIIQLVDEDLRAWHAGQAFWGGVHDINSASIGIEVQNAGHDGGYPDFGARQMDSVVAICQDIVVRHKMCGTRVLAHSDVAPARKCDPGEKFNWRLLYEAGVGHWVAESRDSTGTVLRAGDGGPAVTDLQTALASYGYDQKVTDKFDVQTEQAVTAFQRHFRQSRVDGIADIGTIETLSRLIAAMPASSPGTT